MNTTWWKTAATGWMIFLVGCGLSANPQPPTLWLPAPVKNLTAVRIGNEVHLRWTMPRQTTDKVPLQGAQRAHFCWELTDSGAVTAPMRTDACTSAGEGDFPPGKPADFTAALAAELVSGAPRAAAWYVELQNHAGKTAGRSNAALAATGAAPPQVAGFQLSAADAGVVLHWIPAAPQPGLVLRIHRTLVNPGAPSRHGAISGNAPQQQTLEVDLSHADAGEALDKGALPDHVWKYQAERVLHLGVHDQNLQILGKPSDVATIDARDVFPPAVPRGLAAVADAQAHTINLSWVPDSDPDLGGYIVYRDDLTTASAAERISGPSPLVAPSFTDAQVIPGHHYKYSVSAVDQDGNESARSGEVEEQLPQ